MLHDHVSVALLGDVDAALSALSPEEERALRVRFGLGVVNCDWVFEQASAVPVPVRRQLEAQALSTLRAGAVTGAQRQPRHGDPGGRRPQASGPGRNRRGATVETGGDPDNSHPDRPESPELTPYDINGWDEV